MSKMCDLNIEALDQDMEGKYSVWQGELKGEECTLNIFAPNKKDFGTILSKLDKVRKGYVTMAGDFNMTVDKIRQDYKRKGRLIFTLISKTDLKDVSRESKGDERKISFCSSST